MLTVTATSFRGSRTALYWPTVFCAGAIDHARQRSALDRHSERIKMGRGSSKLFSRKNHRELFPAIAKDLTTARDQEM